MDVHAARLMVYNAAAKDVEPKLCGRCGDGETVCLAGRRTCSEQSR